MNFETLLQNQIRTLLLAAAVGTAGCGSEEKKEDVLCAKVTEVNHTDGEQSREPGFLRIGVGESCPEEPDLSLLQAADCCPVMEAVATCGLVDERTTTALPYYGGYTYDTGPADEFVICEYDGIFTAGNACCGRPFLLQGTELVADIEHRASDWCTDTAPLAGSPELLQAAAAYWLEVAQLEHASVASFGRVALELMVLGAPADLVARSHESALDEIRHAQAAFGLAQALGAGPVAPGPLPLGSTLELSSSLADVAEAVVREGCIGETLAAMDAAARLRRSNGQVAEVLTTIVEDESRHAALGWATLRWLLEVGGEDVRTRVSAVFAEGLPQSEGAEPPREGLGLITESARSQAHTDAWNHVIAPAWSAMSAQEQERAAPYDALA